MRNRFAACVLGIAVVGSVTAVTNGQDSKEPGGDKKPTASAPAEKSKSAQTAARYEDKQNDFSLSAPKGWNTMDSKAIAVPGEVSAAWTPDNQTTIVAFMQKPGQALSPRDVLDQSAAQTSAAGFEVREQEVRDIAGKKAMWMVVAAKGTGGAITGNGEVKTAQVWCAIPREKDLVVLLLTCPDSDVDRHRKAFDQLLKTLKVGGKQTDEQKAAE